MKNLKLFTLVSVFAAVAFIGCSKKGDTGPAGPAGAAGATGATGPAGPDSILYSAWTTLTMTPQVGTAGDTTWFEAITAAGLTSPIMNNGVVLSYIGIPNSTDTAVFSISEASTLVATISQVLFVGEIDLYAASDYSQTLYRYVLIPGSILTQGIAGQKYTIAQLQKMDYADVKKIVALAAKKPTTN